MSISTELTTNQRVLETYNTLKNRLRVRSKTEFARIAGFTNTHWSEYEIEKRRFSHKHLTSLVNHFPDLSLQYLESGRGEPFTELTAASTAEILGTPEDLDYLNLPFVPFTAYGSFISGCHEDRDMKDFGTYKVLRRAGKEYKNAVVIEVRGNSMAPRYPDQSCHVARRVSDGNWQYATGVHALSLRSEMFVIKKITSNINGVLTLTGTATGDTMSVELGDINCMWKVGEAVYMPEEE
jgi:hypothetical protein